jgi:hypothetical protein
MEREWSRRRGQAGLGRGGISGAPASGEAVIVAGVAARAVSDFEGRGKGGTNLDAQVARGGGEANTTMTKMTMISITAPLFITPQGNHHLRNCCHIIDVTTAM